MLEVKLDFDLPHQLLLDLLLPDHWLFQNLHRADEAQGFVPHQKNLSEHPISKFSPDFKVVLSERIGAFSFVWRIVMAGGVGGIGGGVAWRWITGLWIIRILLLECWRRMGIVRGGWEVGTWLLLRGSGGIRSSLNWLFGFEETGKLGIISEVFWVIHWLIALFAFGRGAGPCIVIWGFLLRRWRRRIFIEDLVVTLFDTGEALQKGDKLSLQLISPVVEFLYFVTCSQSRLLFVLVLFTHNYRRAHLFTFLLLVWGMAGSKRYAVCSINVNSRTFRA